MRIIFILFTWLNQVMAQNLNKEQETLILGAYSQLKYFLKHDYRFKKDNIESLYNRTCSINNENINQLKVQLDEWRDFNSNSISQLLSEYEKLPQLNNIKHQEIAEIPVQEIIKTNKRAFEILKHSEELRKKAKKCLFSKQINFYIQNIKSAKVKTSLENLNNIGQCLNIDFIKHNKSFIEKLKTPFETLFNFFSHKEKLSMQDCNVLRRTHELWSSLYEYENFANADNNKIPFYNVNPHNSSYFYWLKEKIKGTIPDEGLSLLHVDTHTDLVHIHARGEHSFLANISFEHIGDLLFKLNHNGKEEMINKVKQLDITLEERNKVLEGINKLSKKELTILLEERLRNNVHRIAQPLVAATASKISKDLVLVLPPWSKDFKRSHFKDAKVVKQDLKLISSDNIIELVFDKLKDTLGISTSEYQPLYPISDYDQYNVIEEKVTLSVTNANDEVKSIDPLGNILISHSNQNLRPFSEYLDTKKFILDIDLDGFVSEGTEDAFEEPESFSRTKMHGGHERSNEGDEKIEVSSLELDLIEKRVDSFFERLKQTKEDGYTPAVITISDSTILNRLIEGNQYDSKKGGQFTPSCLVFLLNYKIRKKLKELYPVDIVVE